MALPVLVYGVCSLVERQRFDLIPADLTRLGLQSWCNICLQGPILSLNGPHLQENSVFLNIMHKDVYITVNTND